MFLPYRVDYPINRIPVVTLAVMLLCNVAYFMQVNDDEQLVDSQFATCVHLQPSERKALAALIPVRGTCEDALAQLYTSSDPESLIGKATSRTWQNSKDEDWSNFVDTTAHAQLQRIRQLPPHKSVTDRLEYRPESWNPITAVTAAFAHGSIAHLLGNLYFFYLFGDALEMILGRLRFALLMLLTAIGSNYGYSVSCIGHPGLPAVGLSGVIFGVMGAFAWAAPTASVRVGSLIFFKWRTVAVPAPFFLLAYVAFNLYGIVNNQQGNVGMVAHVSGALIGVLLAATVFRRPVSRARQMLAAPPQPQLA